MIKRPSKARAAIAVALILGAVTIAALLVAVAFGVFAGDTLQCYMPNDNRTFTPVCS